jgi:hypothetical protein
VFCFSVAYCRAILFLCTGRNLFGEYSFPLNISYFIYLIDLYMIFKFCFSCSGWGIGPSGGVVEPDLVAKMRSDEGSCDNFFYGPSVMVPCREPVANERYSFGDSRYHACGKYAALEKKFFSENEDIMREIFFDTNNLLGVDSDEDLVSADVPVNYYDFVPEMFSEDGQLRRDRIKEILETKIVRMSPVNLEGEDEETMERVASPMVVETISDLTDAGVATCSTDVGVNNQLCLTSAAKPDCVERVVTARVKPPSSPGPFSEDVSMDDFSPRTRRGSVLFLTFCEPAGGEVSLYFHFPYLVVYILLLNSGVC